MDREVGKFEIFGKFDNWKIGIFDREIWKKHDEPEIRRFKNLEIHESEYAKIQINSKIQSSKIWKFENSKTGKFKFEI